MFASFYNDVLESARAEMMPGTIDAVRSHVGGVMEALSRDLPDNPGVFKMVLDVMYLSVASVVYEAAPPNYSLEWPAYVWKGDLKSLVKLVLRFRIDAMRALAHQLGHDVGVQWNEKWAPKIANLSPDVALYFSSAILEAYFTDAEAADYSHTRDRVQAMLANVASDPMLTQDWASAEAILAAEFPPRNYGQGY